MRNVFYIHRVSPDSFLWGILAEGDVVVVPTEEVAEETRAMVRKVDRRCLKDLLEADPLIDVDHARNQSVEVRTSAEHQAARLNEEYAGRQPAQAVPGIETGLAEVVESGDRAAEQSVEEAEAEEATADDAGRKEWKDAFARQEPGVDRQIAEARRRAEIAALEPESGAFAWSPKYDHGAIVRQFPLEGKFEGNIYRPSAAEVTGTMVDWIGKIDNGQLVMEKHLGGNATAVVYTSIMVGEIAGGASSDSIRVVRRDEGKDGRTFYFESNQPWVTREVPKECDTPTKAVWHLFQKINEQVDAFSRACPDCAEEDVKNTQVLCNRGKGRDAGTWWRGLNCRHSTR